MAYESPASEKKGGGKGASDFMATARKRIKSAIEATDENRRYELDDIKFAAGSPDNGWQWPANILQARQNPLNAGGPRPCLTINKLPQHIRLVTNEQRQNRPAIKVIPVDDKSDVEVADVLNGVIRHIEANSDADVAYDTAGECQVTSGEGYWRILTDYVDEKSFDQDILIAPIRNAFSVYMDPDGLRRDSTGRYIQWAFITDQLSEDEFKRQFPDAGEINWEEVGTGDEYQGWFDDKKVRIAEYFCFKEEKKKLYLWPDGMATLEGDDEAAIPYIGQVPLKDRTTTVKKVMWHKMNGLEVLQEREWAGKFIPVVRIAGNEWEVEGKQVVSGIVRNAKDAQRMGNYWESQDAEILALQPKAPYIGTAEQFEGYENEWQQANIQNYAFLKYNAHTDGTGGLVPAPQRQMPPQTNPGYIAAKLQAWDNLQATVGQYNPSIGAEADEKSGKAIMARQRQADVGTYHYIDNQARGIRQTGRILLDLIPKIYDTKRVARIIGEDGEPDHVTLDPELGQAMVEVDDGSGKIEKIYNPAIGQYDVRVTTGPSYTTKRQEAAEFMAQVLSGNKELMAVMGDLYFKMLDVPGADEIAERLKKALPPGLAEDEEDQPEPMVQTPQGPIPASQVPQMMESMTQDMMKLAEQVKAAGDIDKEGQQIAADRAEVKNMLVELKAREDALKMKEQIISATQQADAAKDEAQKATIVADLKIMVHEAIARLDAAKQDQAEAKEGEDAQANAKQNAQTDQRNQAVEGMQQELLQALTQAIQVLAAPRRTRIVNGADGMPEESVSEVVQ